MVKTIVIRWNKITGYPFRHRLLLQVYHSVYRYMYNFKSVNITICVYDPIYCRARHTRKTFNPSYTAVQTLYRCNWNYRSFSNEEGEGFLSSRHSKTNFVYLHDTGMSFFVFRACILLVGVDVHMTRAFRGCQKYSQRRDNIGKSYLANPLFRLLMTRI